MNKPKFTSDKGTQIVLSLLKAHGIKRVIASPGTTNIALVASMQLDPWFEMYSAVDERGAAYMACGMAAATGKPVVITCTGATASRNYYPGMTEAYYRKLPVLAITGSHGKERIGQLDPQVIDRSVIAKDACREAVYIDKINDDADERRAIIDVNKAILALTYKGGGPALIDLRVGISAGFEADSILEYRKISRIERIEDLPELPSKGRIAIFIGSHQPFDKNLTSSIDDFCESHNAVVITDVTSNYNGKYRVAPQLLFAQHLQTTDLAEVDILIHLGETSGDYYTLRNLKPREVWRLSEDGEIKDFFGSLTYVMDMTASDFFGHYADTEKSDVSYFDEFTRAIATLHAQIPQLPLSNVWVAQELVKHLPSDWVIHLAIANSARALNLTEHQKLHNEIRSNVGAFGIDGPISTCIGSALVNPTVTHLLITGDLAFMYDLNSLCNHNLPDNLRIILINNGCGTEFRNYDHPGSQWGEDANPFIAAAGHMGNKSSDLVKNYVSALGMEYYSAKCKDEAIMQLNEFMQSESSGGKVLEIFTAPEDESKAIQLMRTIAKPEPRPLVDRVKNKAKKIFSR